MLLNTYCMRPVWMKTQVVYKLMYLSEQLPHLGTEEPTQHEVNDIYISKIRIYQILSDLITQFFFLITQD